MTQLERAPNLADEAMLLFRRLYRAGADGAMRYRAFKRWQRREQVQPGMLQPLSEVAQGTLRRHGINPDTWTREDESAWRESWGAGDE